MFFPLALSLASFARSDGVISFAGVETISRAKVTAAEMISAVFAADPDDLVQPLFRLQDRKLRDLAILFPIDGLERQKLVKTEDNPFHDRLGHPFERKIHIPDIQRCGKFADVQGTDLLRGLGECPPQTIQREIQSLPQPHDDDPLDRKIPRV